jgi:hypothetical protein
MKPWLPTEKSLLNAPYHSSTCGAGTVNLSRAPVYYQNNSASVKIKQNTKRSV